MPVKLYRNLNQLAPSISSAVGPLNLQIDNPQMFLAVGDRFRGGKEFSTQKGQRETGWDCHMGPQSGPPLWPALPHDGPLGA